MLDLESKKKAVYQYIVQKILSGEHPPGSMLSTGIELARQFDLSRYHVQQALGELYRHNLIVRKKRGGISLQRNIFEYEKQLFAHAASNNILIINHLVSSWQVVHVNDCFYNALLQPLRNAGFTVIQKNCPSMELDSLKIHLESLIRENTPRAIIVIPSNRKMFEDIQEMYYLLHDNVFFYTRTGFMTETPLINAIGIDNCGDGIAAAEAAFSYGGDKIIYCYTSSVFVQHWQLERRYGVQTCLRKITNRHIFIDDFHVDKDFPFTSPRKNTVLIAHNDELAAKLIDLGRLHNLEPGRDYKLIGFGDDCRFAEYGITTLRPDLERIGKELAQMVLDACTTHEKTSRATRLIPSLLIRRKTL